MEKLCDTQDERKKLKMLKAYEFLEKTMKLAELTLRVVRNHKRCVPTIKLAKFKISILKLIDKF